MAPLVVPVEDLQCLTAIPMGIVVGDNIAEPNHDFGIELWRLASQRPKQLVATVNRHHGDASYLEPPEAGSIAAPTP
jgi:hypothetical protein